jgi:hypothetical protein
LFGFCITHILNTGVLKFDKKIRRQKVKERGVEDGRRLLEIRKQSQSFVDCSQGPSNDPKIQDESAAH